MIQKHAPHATHPHRHLLSSRACARGNVCRSIARPQLARSLAPATVSQLRQSLDSEGFGDRPKSVAATQLHKPNTTLRLTRSCGSSPAAAVQARPRCRSLGCAAVLSCEACSIDAAASVGARCASGTRRLVMWCGRSARMWGRSGPSATAPMGNTRTPLLPVLACVADRQASGADTSVRVRCELQTCRWHLVCLLRRCW
jgi:hypothetical protein